MDNKKSKQKAELAELPPKEVQKREQEYNSDLKQFKQGLIAGERFKKDGINKLARDLEKAGTVELHKVSTRIKSDLRTVIEGGYLADNYVNSVPDPKFKGAQGPPRGQQQQHKEEQTGNLNFAISQQRAINTSAGTGNRTVTKTITTEHTGRKGSRYLCG